MVVKEKKFIRTFILELILVQKESVSDLSSDEILYFPSNYFNIIDEILVDDVKKAKYSSLIPQKDIDCWKYNVTRELNDFLKSSGVKYNYVNNDIKISLDQYAISKVLFDNKLSPEVRVIISNLAEDFIQTRTKTKPNEKRLV